VDGRFRLTENTHRVAVQLGDRWATAVEAQARRIQSPENLRVTAPDQWLQVVALHHVLVAAQMARKYAPVAAMKPRIDCAINEFLNAIVIGRSPGMNQREAIALARDVLEHFDEYYCGTGRLQKREQAADPSLSKEDLALRYRPSLGSAGRTALRIGPDPPADPLVEIELASIAPKAARHLVEELAAIVGVDVLAGFGSTSLRSTGA
jgi:hypothetical protein